MEADILVDRERELTHLEALIVQTLSGSGHAVFVEGPAGIGKSALLREALRRAAGRGARVLSARGGELERQSAFGVARQLFAPVIARGPGQHPDAPVSGVTALALGALRLDHPDTPGFSAPPSEPDVHHGLYWLCSDLAECGPVMIALDDAQWADPPSLRWIAYLARRLEDLPLLLVVSLRTSELQHVVATLADVRADPDTVTLRPQPLSKEAVVQVVHRLWGAEPEEEFVRACDQASGGNPFFLRVLAKAAIDEDLLPTAVNVGRLERLVPAGIADAIVARVDRLPSRPVDFVQGVAVLGDTGELRHAAALAGLDQRQAAMAADELVAADLLKSGPPLQFVHPVVRRAVYAAIPFFERRLIHRRAALLLDSEGQPAEAVAAQLLEAEPVGDGWTVEVLRRAAAAAAAAAAPETAIVYLRRALVEPPPTEVRPDLLAELGALEARVGDSQAVEHLSCALEATAESSARAHVAVTLAQALVLAGRAEDAFELLRETLKTAGELPRELRLSMEAELLTIGLVGVEPGRRLVAERRERVEAEVVGGETPAERRVLVFLTQESLLANRPAAHVAQLARRALGDGRLLAEVTAESPAYYTVVDALTFAGHLDLAVAALDDALQDARERGSAVGFYQATLSRCVNHRERGAIRDLEADARAGFDAATVLRWSLYQPIFGAYLAEALVERGELDAARDVLESIPPGSPAAFFASATRGRLHLETGKAEQALEDLLASGRDQLATGLLCPAVYPWRSAAALALARMGDIEGAHRLAAEELALAEAFGAVRPIGVALRALALVERDEEKRIELLRRAESVLEASGALLELARTRADLGAALRRANKRIEARAPLRLALDDAYRLGATGLGQRCSTELAATGARRRRTVHSGLDALTPSELRVVRLATEGLSIREMAQLLFVSRKTVEKHLGQIYSKLGIHSREELQRTTQEFPAMAPDAGRSAPPAGDHSSLGGRSA